MGIFNSIKKSRRESSDIDEKIEYLNKELEKTGLREAMTTSNMYVSGGRVPNEDYNNFDGLSLNGQSLAISGADGNALGGAILGTTSQGYTGVALSPPHPITGVRTSATHLLDGIGTGTPLRPGKSVYRGFFTKTLQTMGGALWFCDSNYNFSGQQGRWLNFEWFGGGWGFWDTSFLGFYFHNKNLDDYQLSGVNIGTQIKNAIAGINFGNDGEIGTPQTLVLTKNNLDDPGFLPINIDGLSTQGFNYLKGRAGLDVSTTPYYSIEDKKNVIDYYRKKQADPNYQPKPYERESLMRQMRAQGDGPQFASAGTSFPPSDPDKFPVDPPPEVPDEPPAPPKPDPDPDSDRKKDPAGLDANAIKAGWNDPYYPVNPDGHYIALVTSAQEALSAEMDYAFYSAAANGESPNYNTAAINKAKETLKNAKEKLDNWERWKKENNYVWKGSIDSSAEAERRKNVLDKDKEIDNELEKLKKDQAQAEADAEMYAAEAQKLIAQFGLDVALTLFGGKILSLAGKAVGKIPAVAKFFKLSKSAQASKIGKTFDKAINAADDGDELYNLVRKATQPELSRKVASQSADDFINFVNSDAMARNISRAIKANEKSIIINFKGKPVRISVEKVQEFRFKGPNYQQLFQSHKPEGKVLSEEDKPTLLEKLKSKGFFNPDDIKPVFPEKPPEELDPKTRMHPKYGKRSARYKRLDPMSADSMPPTGDPETDALVDKQRTKPKSAVVKSIFKKYSKKS